MYFHDLNFTLTSMSPGIHFACFDPIKAARCFFSWVQHIPLVNSTLPAAGLFVKDGDQKDTPFKA